MAPVGDQERPWLTEGKGYAKDLRAIHDEWAEGKVIYGTFKHDDLKRRGGVRDEREYEGYQEKGREATEHRCHGGSMGKRTANVE